MSPECFRIEAKWLCRMVPVLLLALCCGNVLLTNDEVFGSEPRRVQEEASNVEPTAKVEVKVVDRNDRAIEGAEVRIFYWTGVYDEGPKNRTNSSGDATLSDISVDGYAYLQVHAEGFGKSMQMLNLDPDNPTLLTVQMAKAVKGGWITVTDPDGEPVVGAHFQRIDYTDINGHQAVITMDTAKSLGYDIAHSDSNGRLTLPTVPDDSSVTLWVLHPSWKLAKLSKLAPKTAEMARLMLEPGPTVEIRFHSEDLSNEELNQLKANVVFMPTNRGSSATESIRSAFPISDGLVRFTAHPARYNDISIAIDGCSVTPEFSVIGGQPEPRLDLTERENSIFDVLVRRFVKAKGRVVDSEGNPLSKIWVISSVESRPVVAAEKDESKETAYANGGSAETDSEGNFEIDVAEGKANVQVMSSGYFRDPPWSEFAVDLSKPETLTIPDLVLFKVPVLKGKVRGVDGKPVANVIVRMVSTGMGDAPPVGMTDQQGNFEMTMTRIPYAIEGGLETDAFVVAFDPRGSYSGITEVDLKDGSSVSDINVALNDADPSWTLNPIRQQQEEAKKKRLEKLGGESIKEMFKSEAAERVASFPAGARGEMAPVMDEGTWLNTSASSLEEFRGKYVLLDFWFIGCGPCHRDMPSVKLVHKAFADQGFSVVGVHTNMQKPDAVSAFANEQEMDFPIVVDNAAGEIIEAYQELGLVGFPNYILLDPDGKIVLNDALPNPDEENQYDLRSSKIEIIYNFLRNGKLP